LVVLLLSVQLGVAGRAHAQGQFSAIVTFGTSLSDSGNAFALIKTNATPPDFGMEPEDLLVPSAPYARGGHHLSNGATWVEQLANTLHVNSSANPAFASRNPHALNYAVGGGRALEDGVNLNLPTQIGAFLHDVRGAAPPDALYAIEMGSNDVRDALLVAGVGDPLAVNSAAVKAIGTAIDALYAAGARQFLVLDVPPIALTPAVRLADGVVPGTAFLANQLTLDFNHKLMTMLNAKAAYPGIRIVPLDIYGLVATIVTNPHSFGLSNVTDACLTPNVAPFTCKNPDQYLFWDGIHPTKAVHAIFAEQADVAVSAP
jgi:phospholipase/lecithinase/hemolysin